MSAKYWIKLYIEILDDPKMATLPDRLWRRVVELFMCAGKLGDDGSIPDVHQLAWLLRMDSEELYLDLKQIATTGIIRQTDTGWLVTKFEERQGPVPASQRMREYRDRQQKQQYYGNVTTPLRNVTQINRLTESDTETETEQTAPAFLSVNPVKVLCDASGLSAFPANQLEWAEVIRSLMEDHGVEATTQAMREACNKWVSTKGQNGRPYKKTNLSWINWAQEILAGGSITAAEKDPSQMTSEEWLEWKRKQAQQVSEPDPKSMKEMAVLAKSMKRT